MKTYKNPLTDRYNTEQMAYLFSDEFKFRTWRSLWVSLAQNQHNLGLEFIKQDQIDAMKAKIDDIDFALAHEFEKKFKHDVMAHVHTFGEQVPSAAKIIHLGVTSAFVQDNTNLIQIKQALELIRTRLVVLLHDLCDFALANKDLATLGFTHFQPAQLTTVGKRACLWMQSFFMNLEELDYVLDNLAFRGIKGTTGTQASFQTLFDNDYAKVVQLDELVTKDFGFQKRLLVTGQTYDRLQDTRVLQLLTNIATSAHKFTNDFRLLQHLKEIEEPFAKNQIGSSAMAYKRNPMRCERVSSLAKFVISLEANGPWVAATQWFERTLDDSANKRLSHPQAFLATEALLNILTNIVDKCVVYPQIIKKHVNDELPFMITEKIMMQATKNGANRQEVHEIIRKISMQESHLIKNEGLPNNLIAHLLEEPRLKLNKEQLERELDPQLYIGFSVQQTEEYVAHVRAYIGEKPTKETSTKNFEL
ncbi:adenylosuccinate lyase [Ureaplasma miroungigenitalium]|uniref:Adenylosuccinate lyase n=1 Tax=Ureaplasma miroungigenitalium TaxID=1042321 RepID=A0ABT3BME9_9BACT|nr:adenylosuccinate lyase [Ureaplasma miroungigenitalium]MCV3728425.1 adenylosuccinate lyase [Ureaplasma miroungigenitalium]